MRKLLTASDIKILHALSELGPRNLTKLAKNVGMHRDTLDFRIERMKTNPQIFLRMHTCVYHTYLGLRKAFVIAEAKPGLEQLLFECLKANSFWLYVCRSYGTTESCTAIYAVPADHCAEFEQFIHEIHRLGVAQNVEIHWSTCFQYGRINPDWFDSKNENWVFRWEDWIEDVQKQTTDLPYTLVEAKSYSILADDIDVKMLMWLEADATKTVKEIAKTLGISRPRAQFHYKKHLQERKFIEGYEIFIMRYEASSTLLIFFLISFHDYETYAKFTRSLLNKFFVLTMGKIIGENTLLVALSLPINEFRSFIDALSKLAKMRLVKNYKYIFQDLRIRSRQTFSGEFFNGTKWIYDNETHLKTLQQKIAESIVDSEKSR